MSPSSTFLASTFLASTFLASTFLAGMSGAVAPLAAAASAGIAVALLAAAFCESGVHVRDGRRRRPASSDRLGGDGIASPRAPAVVVRALQNAAIDVEPTRAVRGWLTAVAAAVAGGLVLSVGPLVIAVVVVGPPAAVTALRGRRAAMRRRNLPIALDTVASSLRSGRSVAGAMSSLGRNDDPLARELRAVAARADAGRRLADVISDWSDTDDADTRLAGAALATAAQLGGPAATALETTAQSLRERAAADGVVEALSVQARMSAWLLTVAPLGFAAVMTGIDPAAGHFLFGTPIGWACLAIGLGLDVVGGLWMHRMVSRAR